MEKTVKQTWVTTTDNPFDPFDQYKDWARYDEDHGYNTLSYMMRIAKVSNEEGEETYWSAIEDAVDDIVKMNVTGNYKKVERIVPFDLDES